MIRQSPVTRVFNGLNLLFLWLVAALCILPLVHVLALSLSSDFAVTAGRVSFWPVGLSTLAYEKSFKSSGFLVAMRISVFRAALGSLVEMFLCMLAAYSLSKDGRMFKARGFYAWFFVFTMLFSGGLIPSYFVVKMTGLIDRIWALILPGAVNAFNVVIMMNFFRGIPRDLEEAAYIDGAGHVRVLFQIFFPISLPSFATLTLFSLVGHWNAWFDGMIYMTNVAKYPLATFLRALIVNSDYSKVGMNPADLKHLSERSLKAAQIFIGSVPILLVYPFLQRYFIQGATLGAVKE
jgi:putative aldouronate transport system permease protein